jgi:galactokinase
MAHAPGRLNLIGEHTDYNNGFAMLAAIDKGIQFAVGASTTETLIYSLRHKQFLSVDLKNIQSSKSADWHNYLLGVLYQLQQRGHVTKPFTCVFDGDLPDGAGLSASSAMGCGFVAALNRLFNLKLSPMEMIQIAQWAEHHFVGVKCSIMDPFTSMMGKENHVLQLDCKTLEYEYHPMQLGDYCLLICNTNAKPSFTPSEYNMRRDECAKGVVIIRKAYSQVHSLRDVKPEMLEAFRGKMPGNIFSRCRYVVEENARVLEATKDLRRGNIKAFGQKMYKTHEGLSKLYEVSCPELDFLVSLTKAYAGIAGSRMMGDGFGGSTITLIERSALDNFITDAKAAYKDKFNRQLTYQVVHTGNGAGV